MEQKYYLHELIENSNPFFIENRNWDEEKWEEDENGWFTIDKNEANWIGEVVNAFKTIAKQKQNGFLKNLTYYDDVVEYAEFLEARSKM